MQQPISDPWQGAGYLMNILGSRVDEARTACEAHRKAVGERAARILGLKAAALKLSA